MLKLTSSNMPLFYYSLRFLKKTNEEDPIVSRAVTNLLYVICQQALSLNMPNAVPLTSARREIACLKKGIFAVGCLKNSDIPFSVCLPVHAILEICEEFTLLRACELNEQEDMRATHEFFFNCGWDSDDNFNFTCLQSRLMHLLHFAAEESLSTEASSSMDEPFLIKEKFFFEIFFSGLSALEITLFESEYLSFRQSAINDLRNDMDMTISVVGFFSIFYGALQALFISQNDLNFCQRLSKKFIAYFSSRLDFFCKPELISYFVWECFRFSGLLINKFSAPDREEDEEEEDLGMARLNAQSKTFWMWLFPKTEGFLRFHKGGSFSSVELCKEFFLAYNLTGRSTNFDWPRRPSSHIIPECLPLFQCIFIDWLAFCRSKILPFVKANDIVNSSSSRCPLSGSFSLAGLSALRCLEVGPESDVQKVELLNFILRDDEGAYIENKMHFFLLAQFIFAKYEPQENAKRCIACYVSDYVKDIEAHRPGHAKIHFLSLLRMIPYCELTYTSFARVRHTVKLFLFALKKDNKEQKGFTQHALSCYMMWIFSSEELTSLRLNSIPHLRRAFSLF